MDYNENLFRLIPKIDELMEQNSIKGLLCVMPRKTVVDSIREEIDILRKSIKDRLLEESDIKVKINHLPNLIIDRANNKNSNKLKKVINGTGIVIHTNIGRSLIGDKVMENIRDIATNYSNLEYDLDEGKRGSRYSHLKEIIVEIVGGEDAMVVNNNAAAVLLVLSTLAKGKEVIVSRGELVEIGGSFRIPDVMEQSGAMLRAVGTTNKTHLSDFENAITEQTAALLKVHTSNYRILGFTSSVSAEELFSLKSKYNLPLIEDLGSGVLMDLSKFGLGYEPTVQESIRKGIDIVTFSGDKLLGGPQAGIIVGKREYINAMKRNPLTRAFRVDKFIIAALEATFRLYLDERTAVENIPTLKMLSLGINELEKRATILYNKIMEEAIDYDCTVKIVNSFSEVGGGSLPLEEIPSKCIQISVNSQSINEFEANLRKFRVPIIARVYKDCLLIDLRTVRETEFETLAEGLIFGLKELKGCIR